MTGRFIVLEGIDGSGTTTQSARLARRFEESGRSVCLTAEPSTGPVGQFLRRVLRREITDATGAPHSLPWSAMALLFAADRLDHVETVVRPALARGSVVVSDRYVLSSLAYQSLTSPGGAASLPWITEINSRALRPDLTVVVDVDPDVAAARRASRSGPAELFEVAELQRRLAGAYARAAELLPGQAVVHVADGTPDEVHDRIWMAVTR